jgi:hypothetical protein
MKIQKTKNFGAPAKKNLFLLLDPKTPLEA